MGKTTYPNPWMRFHPNHFVADAGRLSHQARSAYIMLICRAWTMDGKLKNDVDWLAQMALSKPAVIKSLLEYLTLAGLCREEDGFLRLRFVDAELPTHGGRKHGR
jgi:uncharacterized protein YdaU (DUF1376 family)